MPFRNEEGHIARCLEALRHQQGFDGEHEVVAVADRSTDASAAVVGRFPGVRLLVSRTPGPYAARNVGIDATDGEIVAFTDGDCEPTVDWLQRIGEAFEQPDVAAVVGVRTLGRDSFSLSLLSAYDLARDDYIFGGTRAELYYGSANNIAFRREALDEFGPFAERRRGADTLLIRQLVNRRGPGAVVYSPRVIVRHLEITRATDYYRKCFVYGRSMRRLHGMAPGRPLRTSERIAVWRAAS